LNGANTGYNIESFYATGGNETIKYTFNVNMGDNFIFGISSFNQTNHNLIV
jgi:competence protein ComGF